MAGGRKLSGEDQALWDRVLRSVRPLRADRPDSAPVAASAGAPKPPEDPAGHADRAKGAPPGGRQAGKPPPKATAAPYYPPVSSAGKGRPALSQLEPRQKRRLARGQNDVDDRLDLHGMRQATAFHTLAGFLRRAQSRRLKTVLVITGKGSPSAAANDDERGVLRRLVPQWLAGSEFRDLVVGFEPASRRHGGAGALYVRIRRRR